MLLDCGGNRSAKIQEHFNSIPVNYIDKNWYSSTRNQAPSPMSCTTVNPIYSLLLVLVYILYTGWLKSRHEVLHVLPHPPRKFPWFPVDVVLIALASFVQSPRSITYRFACKVYSFLCFDPDHRFGSRCLKEPR